MDGMEKTGLWVGGDRLEILCKKSEEGGGRMELFVELNNNTKK
jgi:hypothetical protein